jgi:cytochrome c2
MKSTVLITATLLILAGPAASDETVVQEGYEVALSNLRLPRAEDGTIVFKKCDECDYVRVAVGPETIYRVNGRLMSLEKFRMSVAKAMGPENVVVGIGHHIERNLVTVVSVSL